MVARGTFESRVDYQHAEHGWGIVYKSSDASRRGRDTTGGSWAGSSRSPKFRQHSRSLATTDLSHLFDVRDTVRTAKTTIGSSRGHRRGLRVGNALKIIHTWRWTSRRPLPSLLAPLDVSRSLEKRRRRLHERQEPSRFPSKMESPVCVSATHYRKT